MAKDKDPLWKIIITDTGGVILLLLVPVIGPLPGPGGIPLLIAGFGMLAINHDWADGAVKYVKKHSENLRDIIFPKTLWIQRSWDGVSVLLLTGGTLLNLKADHWFWVAISYGVMASSTTVFMFNRNRLAWLDKYLRRTGSR